MKSLEILKKADMDTLRQIAELEQSRGFMTLQRLLAESLAAQDEENRMTNAEALHRGQGASLYSAELIELLQKAGERYARLKQLDLQNRARRHENAY